MKKVKNIYYNNDDEIHFQKLDNFRKFNSNKKDDTFKKNQDIKYSNADKNNFNSILKTDENSELLNESNSKKSLDYYNNSDFKTFDKLDNFPEYNFSLDNSDENKNGEINYSRNDYGQFNKIIKTENKDENLSEEKNKKVKVIDYGKVNENNKKLKNKVGIEKIKIVYFD